MESGEATTSVDGFFPRDVSWRHLGQLARPRLHAAAIAVGDILYVIGGMSPEGEPLMDGEALNWRTGAAVPDRALAAPPGGVGAVACIRVPRGTPL